MVKNKSGSGMNPADAFRKAQRQKEIARNRRERQFVRQAARQVGDAEAIKAELSEVLALEEAGTVGTSVRLKKKVLQQAYEAALIKKKAQRAWGGGGGVGMGCCSEWVGQGWVGGGG